MNSCKIAIDYPGSIISSNHYKHYGGIYTKPEAKAFMEELGWKVKAYHIEDWKRPLHVTCSGVFKDKRSQPDLSNLSKVILDAIQEATRVNDRDMRWHDGQVLYGSNPVLMITIEENNEAQISNT